MQADDRDENLSWLAAAIIMSLVTVGTVILRVLGLDPFTDIFDSFIVYLPTAILVGVILVQKLRGSSSSTGFATVDQSTAQNKAV